MGFFSVYHPLPLLSRCAEFLDYRETLITHVAFEVDDLEEAQRHLKNSNIPIVCGPRPRFDGKEQLYFCDPDGYAIELFAQKK